MITLPVPNNVERSVVRNWLKSLPRKSRQAKRAYLFCDLDKKVRFKNREDAIAFKLTFGV